MSYADKDGWMWVDGEFVDWRNSKVHILTHSLHYGLSLFEGVRAYKTEDSTVIFRLEEHTQRLFESAKLVNIDIPFSKEVIDAAQKEILIKNKLDSAYIRPLVWLGSEKMGVPKKGNAVHVAIAVWQMGTYLGADKLNSGIRVKTATYRRPHINSTHLKAKASGNYISSILANDEATRLGFDEALLLDTDGYVAEGSAANFFIVKNNTLYTPETKNCLAGITRDSILEIAKSCGYKVSEMRLTLDDVYCADEAFFTGTAIEIMPIVELDNRKICDGLVGSVTRELQEKYRNICHAKDPKYSHWLTEV
jgi:branched-chain amino acid aminotransferase